MIINAIVLNLTAANISIAKSGADVTAISNWNTIELLYNSLSAGRIPNTPPSAIPDRWAQL